MSKKFNDKYYARYGDPRTADWWFMGNQMWPFVLGVWYLIATKVLLPRLMRNRSPWKLYLVTVGYNIGMAILNGWVFYQLGLLTWWNGNFKWSCQSIDWSNTEDALKVAELGWIFFIITILERETTVLVVLRKQDSRLAFLHTFLRLQAPIVVWYGTKYAPGGYNSLYILLSALLGAVAHFHYAVVVGIPALHHPYWQRLTLPFLYTMQFAVVFIYYTQLYFFPPKGCKLSFFVLRLNIASAILYFIFAKDIYLSIFKSKDKKSDISTASKKTL